MCHVMSSCGNCLFAYTSHPTGYIPEFLTALTGREHDFDSCVTIGERIENIRHLFNLREGINPLTITVNQRSLGRPPLEKGATAGITIDEEALIDEYCAAMELGPARRRCPARRKLEELGLRPTGRRATEGRTISEHEHAQRPQPQGRRPSSAPTLEALGLTLPFDDEVDSGPGAPLAQPFDRRRSQASATGSPSCRWRAGTTRPTASPPT